MTTRKSGADAKTVKLKKSGNIANRSMMILIMDFPSIRMADQHLSLTKATFIISKHLASGSKVQTDALGRSDLDKMIPCIDAAVISRSNLANSMVTRLLNGSDSSPTRQHPGYLCQKKQFGL